MVRPQWSTFAERSRAGLEQIVQHGPVGRFDQYFRWHFICQQVGRGKRHSSILRKPIRPHQAFACGDSKVELGGEFRPSRLGLPTTISIDLEKQSTLTPQSIAERIAASQ